MNIASDDEITRKLASTLRRLGIGTLALAALALILAFTGYDTPRSVNVSCLIGGLGLFILGRLCMSTGRSFGHASGEAIPETLRIALSLTDRMLGYLFVLIAIATLGVGLETVFFLNGILTRI